MINRIQAQFGSITTIYGIQWRHPFKDSSQPAKEFAEVLSEQLTSRKIPEDSFHIEVPKPGGNKVVLYAGLDKDKYLPNTGQIIGPSESVAANSITYANLADSLTIELEKNKPPKPLIVPYWDVKPTG